MKEISLETLEQKCLKGRLSGRMEHPDGMFCYWNNKRCRFVDTENTIAVNYVDGKGKQDHYRCRCVMKEGEPMRE